MIHIRAKETNAFKRVFGLTSVERLLFELARCGVDRVTVVTGHPEKLKTLRKPADMQIETSPEEPAQGVGIDGTVIFLPKTLCNLLEQARKGVSFMLAGREAISADEEALETKELTLEQANRPFESKQALKQTKRMLLNSLRKPMLIDGIVGYYVMRPITLRISSVLSNTGVTPNMVTAFCMFLGLAGAVIAGMAQDINMVILGAFLYFAGATLDCVDGEISRLKHLGSRFGAWFDTISDDSTTLAFTLGMGVYLYRSLGDVFWLYFAVAGGISFVISQTYVYYYLVKVFDSGDLLDFVWSFQEGKKQGEPGFSDYFLLLAKRDFFSALLFVLAIFNQVKTGLILVSSSMVVYLIVVVIDVIQRRKRQ